MWITRRLHKKTGARLWGGQVSTGEQMQVLGESEYRAPETVYPYGFNSLPGSGSRAVMLDGLCAGVSAMPDSDLKEGEVRLFSGGGAEILLRNTGEVVINGQVFAPKD